MLIDYDPIDGEHLPRLRRRLEALKPEARPRWGRLDPAAMLAHLERSLRITLGEIQVPDISNPFTRHLMPPLVFNRLPWPRALLKAPEEFFDPDPPALDAARAALLQTLERFARQGDADPQTLLHSPLFGSHPAHRWQAWQGRHFEHHLRQFDL